MTDQEPAVQGNVTGEHAGTLMLRLQHLRFWQTARSFPLSQEQLMPELAQERDRLAEALWHLLKPDLYKVARGWQRSHAPRSVIVSEAVNSTALIGFSYIVQGLETTCISLDGNPIGLSCSIAWRALNGEHQRELRRLTVLSRPRPDEQPPESEVLPARIAVPVYEAADVVADPSLNQDDVIALMTEQEIWSAMRTFLESIRDEKYLTILTLRVQGMDFNTIAAHLGEGWTSNAVRQRLCRLRPKLAAELRRLGLIGDKT